MVLQHIRNSRVAEQKIVLQRAHWVLDDQKPLGKAGGFGAVFEGTDTYGQSVAVKRLHLNAAAKAHREMRIAEDLAGKNWNNIMPVYDAGEFEQQFFVVMPKADHSLQDAIERQKTFPEREAAEILLQIASGLTEVSHLVHRDLKPGNVLMHTQNWKIADFGIARFVEETTSLHTLQSCLSPHYAAPEQWQYESPTSATDVYALGCIGYTLLTGNPPFQKELLNLLRAQHLGESPPRLSGVHTMLQSILYAMLRKTQGARITLSELKKKLETFVDSDRSTARTSISMLSSVDSRIQHEKLVEDSKKNMLQIKATERGGLQSEGRQILKEVMQTLAESVVAASSAAVLFGNDQISLGKGQIDLDREVNFEDGVFRESKWDVVCGRILRVSQKDPDYSWSSSLLYAKPRNQGRYRWYEISFWSLSRRKSDEDIFGLLDVRDIDCAIGPVMHIYDVNFGPAEIDEDSVDDFVDRWCHLLALAAEGKLVRPNVLPTRGTFWK